MNIKINTAIKGIIEKNKDKIVWLTMMLSFLIAMFVYILIVLFSRNINALIVGLFVFTAPLLTFLVYFIHTKPLAKKNIFNSTKNSKCCNLTLLQHLY